MFKLCFGIALIACLAVLIEGQKYSRPVQYTSNRFNPQKKISNQRSAFQPLPPSYQPRGTSSSEELARVITQHNSIHRDGVYEYVFETENGIRSEEHSAPRQLKSGEIAGVVEGSYMYTSPEGLNVLVEYSSDEDGFHPRISYSGNGAEQFINGQNPSSVIINH